MDKHIKIVKSSTPLSIDALLARIWECAEKLCIIVLKPPCVKTEARVIDKALLENMVSAHLGSCWILGFREGVVGQDEPLIVLAAPCGKPLEGVIDALSSGRGVEVRCVEERRWL